MPLTNAAKAEHVSSERLRAYVLKSGIARRTGRGWVIKVDLRIRRMQSTTTEGRKTVDVALDQASKVGTHESAIGRFVEDNDFAHLKPFIGQGFFDIHGKQHNFETRPNHLYRLANSGGESFENIYRVLA